MVSDPLDPAAFKPELAPAPAPRPAATLELVRDRPPPTRGRTYVRPVAPIRHRRSPARVFFLVLVATVIPVLAFKLGPKLLAFLVG